MFVPLITQVDHFGKLSRFYPIICSQGFILSDWKYLKQRRFRNCIESQSHHDKLNPIKRTSTFTRCRVVMVETYLTFLRVFIYSNKESCAVLFNFNKDGDRTV